MFSGCQTLKNINNLALLSLARVESRLFSACTQPLNTNLVTRNWTSPSQMSATAEPKDTKTHTLACWNRLFVGRYDEAEQGWQTGLRSCNSHSTRHLNQIKPNHSSAGTPASYLDSLAAHGSFSTVFLPSGLDWSCKSVWSKILKVFFWCMCWYKILNISFHRHTRALLLTGKCSFFYDAEHIIFIKSNVTKRLKLMPFSSKHKEVAWSNMWLFKT